MMLLGLSSRYISPAGFELLGQLRFMKEGLKFARRITTVSPTCAREIATPEFGLAFDHDGSQALVDCLHRAAFVHRERPEQWRALMRAGMTQDLSWMKPAQGNLELYDEMLTGSV